ncbi:site-specific integrase [uncultured Dysosmobacter sp.]|uniref:tyrosine-type recombinase/integrase n=1 Tax=uncultured Dysosmobacter sp. TaxID=2591384 RepID=UPI002618601F|nr:site-specific integrase [uncultured Dysosmobacter sp.]
MGRKRKNGEGTVRLRKDGRWEGRVVIGYDDKGLPKTKNVLAKTKGECVEKLKALRDSIDRPAPRTTRADMPFGEWLTFWYEKYSKPNVRPNTQRGYERLMETYIRPKLGQVPLNKLTAGDIQQLCVWMKTDGRIMKRETRGAGISDSQIHNCYSLCRRALDQAVEECLIPKNPALDCKAPTCKRQEMNILSKEEMRKLLIQANQEGYYEVFLMEFATGLRLGELMALQWDDLNMTTGELRINKQIYPIDGKLTISEPKTDAGIRTLILPPSVLNVMREYRKTVDSRWMFPSPKVEDAPIGPSVIRHRLNKLLDHAGCRQVRFHDLRHGFATNALAHGMDVKTLSTILGHTSGNTTLNIYTHATDTMRKSAAEKIDRGIAKAEPKQELERATEQLPAFQPTKGRKRKWGTGSVTQCNTNRWRGYFSRVWPDGTTHFKDVYAPTKEECEALLREAISEMKKAITAERERMENEVRAS